MGFGRSILHLAEKGERRTLHRGTTCSREMLQMEREGRPGGGHQKGKGRAEGRSLQRKLRRCSERMGEKPVKCGVPGGREKARGGKRSTISNAVDNKVRCI